MGLAQDERVFDAEQPGEAAAVCREPQMHGCEESGPERREVQFRRQLFGQGEEGPGSRRLCHVAARSETGTDFDTGVKLPVPKA